MWVLLFFLLATPTDHALYTEDGKTPKVYATLPDCLVEARKQSLKIKAARIPGVVQCVPGKVGTDGVIIEAGNAHG